MEEPHGAERDEHDDAGADPDVDPETGDHYVVGYGKPPRHTRFKPGKSGNPRGRPRGARALRTDLREALSGRHTIQINGKPRRGNRQELMMLTLATRAASGDLKAAAILLPLILQVLGYEDGGGEKQGLSAQDQALLDELLGLNHRNAEPHPEAGSGGAGGRNNTPPAACDDLPDPDEGGDHG